MTTLAELADHPAVVFLAYIAALLPLTVLFALDFINEKWRTVADTRRSGHVYLFSSIPPLCFVMFYIHLQRLSEDYKEMAAATSAAIFCIFHILRTLWGLVQLDGFKQWNVRALRTLNNIGYEAPVYESVFAKGSADVIGPNDSSATSESLGSTENGLAKINFFLRKYIQRVRSCILRTYHRFLTHAKGVFSSSCKYHSKHRSANMTDCELSLTIDQHMVVNSSLVDNEFNNAELPCRLKKSSMVSAAWNSLTRRSRFRVSDHLECSLPLECSVNWLVVFLARFGSQWLIEKSQLNKLENFRLLPVAERCEMFRRRVGMLAVLQTTYGDGADQVSLFSPLSPPFKSLTSHEEMRVTVAERAGLPYKCSGYDGNDEISFESFSATIREVLLGWDLRALSVLKADERASVENMTTSQITFFAKVMSARQFEPDGFGAAPRFGISEQVGNDPRIALEFMTQIPVSVTCNRKLWGGKSQNNDVDQASLHIDNWVALESGRRAQNIADLDFQGENCSIFMRHKTLEIRGYQCEMAQASSAEQAAAWDIKFFGCVTESVRAFLAQTIDGQGADAVAAVDWKPSFEKTKFPFSCSEQLRACLPHIGGSRSEDGELLKNFTPAWSIETRLLWELQYSFHSAVSAQAESCSFGSLLGSAELMVLCILGYPSLAVKKVSGKPACDLYADLHATGGISDARLNIYEHDDSCECCTRRECLSVTPVGGPQSLSLLLFLDSDSGMGHVKLAVDESKEQSKCFNWQAWKDSFIGRLAAQSEWRVCKDESTRKGPPITRYASNLASGVNHLGERPIQMGGWPQFFGRMPEAHSDGMIKNRSYALSTTPVQTTQEAAEYPSSAKVSRKVLQVPRGTVLEQARCARNAGDFPYAIKLFCKCISGDLDPVALEEAMDILREKGEDFAKTCRVTVHRSLETVLRSIILSKTEETAHCVGKENKIIGLRQLEACFCFFSTAALRRYYFLESHARCLFELRNPKLLSVVEEYASISVISGSSLMFVALYFLDHWKSSGDAFAKCLAEIYLRRYGFEHALVEKGMRIGYLFEKGTFRGRQSFQLNTLCSEDLLPNLSFKETACHFISDDDQSVHAVRRSPATAVKIYEHAMKNYSDGTMAKSRVMNRLGLVRMINAGVLQDFEQADRLFSSAKGPDCKDALCNLAVLQGFHYRDWASAKQHLTEAVAEHLNFLQGEATIGFDQFQRPDHKEVVVNGRVQKIWDHSDICQDPHTSSMNNLAILYEVSGDTFEDAGRALKLYQRILEIDENPVALLNMAALLKAGPTSLRDETAANSLLRKLQLRLPDIEHMLVLSKSIESLELSNPGQQSFQWSLAVEELDNCAVLVKSLSHD